MKNVSFLLLCLLIVIPSLHAQDAPREEAEGFYDWKTIQEIHITFEEENWNELLDSMRLYGNTLLAGTVKIGDQSYPDAGIRYRESRSFQIGQSRNALHIELDFALPSQNHQGYQTIILSNALRDPSMMREVLAFEIAGNYMPAPKANYANVTINGEPYGFFVNIEAPDENFFRKHFEADDNTLVKAAPNIGQTPDAACKKNVYSSLSQENNKDCYRQNYQVTPSDGWDDLLELINTLHEDSENIEEILQVDQVLWMHAFNTVLVNLSSYSGQHSNNYLLFQDDFGVFYPIVWDLNLAFGSFKNIGSGSDLSIGELEKLSPFLHQDNALKPLLSKLLNVPSYRKTYISHVRTILHDHFKDGKFEKRLKELQELIAPYVRKDANKSYTLEEFNQSLQKVTGKKSMIPGLLTIMKNRYNFLSKLEELEIIPPKITDIEVFHRPKYSNKKVSTFKFTARVSKMPENVFLYYRFHKNEPWEKVAMEKDGAFEMDDKEIVFQAEIDPEGRYEDVQFYFMTSNVGASDFYPSNYMFNPFEANLQELNQ